MTDIAPQRTLFFTAPPMVFDGNSKVLRASFITYPPGAQFLMDDSDPWQFKGLIAIYMLEGDTLSIFNLTMPDPNDPGDDDARQFGTLYPPSAGFLYASHDWQSDNTSPNFPLHPGEAVAFQSGFQHSIRNDSTTTAKILVLSAIEGDKCGATYCAEHP